MATVRQGDQAVLLVVDVQVGVMAESSNVPRTVANVARAVERARVQQVPVIWVQHEDDELARDSAAWQWVPELVPAAGEARIYKRYHSSFEHTELDATLARLGASHIVLAGAMTNWCIRATAHGALERGYDLTLVSDAHTTGPLQRPDGTVLPAEAVVDELNNAINGLSYPGRRNRTVKVDALDFAASGR